MRNDGINQLSRIDILNRKTFNRKEGREHAEESFVVSSSAILRRPLRLKGFNF